MLIPHKSKVAVIGSRNFNDYEKVKSVLEQALYYSHFEAIVSGGARGADSLGARFAKERGLDLIEFQADWDNLNVYPCKIKTNKKGKQYNSLAGFIRNQKIIDCCDWVVAFWDGISPGTKDSIEKAKNAGKLVYLVEV